MEKLFTGRSANGKHAEPSTPRQIEFELSSDIEGLSPKAGSSNFSETSVSDSESDQANSGPYKGLDQDQAPRSMGSHRDKPTSSGRKRKATQDNEQPIPTKGKKLRKLTGDEQIASDIQRWTDHSARKLEQRRLEKMKP